MKAIKRVLPLALFTLGLLSCTPQAIDDKSDASTEYARTGDSDTPIDDERDE